MPRGKWRFGTIYGSAGVMGYSPREVDQMTVYELTFLQSSYAKAHGMDKDAAPSDDAFFERTGVA